jgi:hypothetical protein
LYAERERSENAARAEEKELVDPSRYTANLEKEKEDETLWSKRTKSEAAKREAPLSGTISATQRLSTC